MGFFGKAGNSASNQGRFLRRAIWKPMTEMITALPNTLTRVGETESDQYSLMTVNEPDALATALVKTAEYRYPRPSALEEALFYTHPSVEKRALRAMEWKAAHPAGETTAK